MTAHELIAKRRFEDMNTLRLQADLVARAASHLEDLARQFNAPVELVNAADRSARAAWLAENAAYDAFRRASGVPA